MFNKIKEIIERNGLFGMHSQKASEEITELLGDRKGEFFNDFTEEEYNKANGIDPEKYNYTPSMLQTLRMKGKNK